MVLPDYIVPTHFATLERLPLTANGKIDRNALPPISLHNNIPAETSEEPGSESSNQFLRTPGPALGLKRVNRQDNFFHLGGHSWRH